MKKCGLVVLVLLSMVLVSCMAEPIEVCDLCGYEKGAAICCWEGRKGRPTKENTKHDYMKNGISYISYETLKKWMKEPEPPVIVDVITSASYAKHHIPGAINIHSVGITEEKVAKLDKDKRTVVYCTTFTCDASEYVVRNLIRWGFRDVHDYKGGIMEWMKREGTWKESDHDHHHHHH
ncbi:MAG: rhodanese-like domain-containing protein [Planctomycetota bacterium]|jgi:rhodanese-related sulfurtransferase